eukprot:Phypoly_transcript_08186.p1 GENE.Phypoly_transcript_08186~~Phypoly_transcript_08186.p1  ORF type:complete len:301 (+),score=92.60 Phypoly_transcript_08186:546-1448(+)
MKGDTTLHHDTTKKDEENRQRIREMETTIESEKSMMLRERAHLAEEAAACERERKALGELKVQLYEERRLFDRETLALTTIGSEVEQKSAMIAQLHREAAEMKAKAEKDLAEAKELHAELAKKEEEIKNERKEVQKERVDSVKERKQKKKKKKKKKKKMLQQQNQNLRAQTPSPSSLPDYENKDIPVPSIADAEWRHQLKQWSKEREEAQNHIEDQVRFLYTAGSAPLATTITHVQQQKQNLHQQQQLQQQLQQKVQQQHLPHLPLYSFPPNSPSPTFDPAESGMMSYLRLSTLPQTIPR